MAAPRKIFRIEETAAARLSHVKNGIPASPDHAELMQALNALRCLMAAPPAATANAANPGPKPPTPVPALETARLARVAQELEAVTTGTAQATQKILAAAEEIDQLANNLSAALKDRIEQGLAQDISDLVIGVFEACNFQDVISQRIAKVMMSLQSAAEHDTAGNETCSPPQPPALHGPRLDGDSGHISQTEIDALFGG